MDGEKYKVGTSHDSISISNDGREPYKKLQMSDDNAITSNQQAQRSVLVVSLKLPKTRSPRKDSELILVT